MNKPAEGPTRCVLSGLIPPGVFKALCDPTRFALFARLAQQSQPATVSHVAKSCPVDVSVVSRHLAILRDAGLVEAARRGKEVYYQVRARSLAAQLRTLADALEACCPPGAEK